MEGSLKALREEKGRIATERLELQRQRQETEADMMKMEEEKLRLKAEREKLDKAMWQLRQKTRELEEAAEVGEHLLIITLHLKYQSLSCTGH